MSYELPPLKSYVRFYLAIVSQLERVWQSLVAIEIAVRDELGPFAEDLAPVPMTAVATLVDSPRTSPIELDELFRPEDAAELTGLTDIYQVVGRFTFQGEDDANLARVSKLVETARAAATENEQALRALEGLKALALETAERMETEEKARAAVARAMQSAKLEPLIETVLLRARQTQDALHAVPIPALDDPANAGDEYKKLRARMQQVYQTCLPFLKNAIAQVWDFVGAPVPQSFPDELPLVEALPPELLTVTAVGSEDVEKAERTLQALAAEAIAMKKAKDDVAVALTKLEGEIAAAMMKREEAAKDVEYAGVLFDWVRLGAMVGGLKKRADDLEGELRARIAASAEYQNEANRIKLRLDEETKALEAKQAESDALAAEHEEISGKEPLLFGKEEWRKKVAELGATVEADRAVLAQQIQAVAQRKMELGAAEVRVQTARAEEAIVERSLADVRQRRLDAEKTFTQAGEKLGSRRPTRLVPPEEVEEIVHALEQKQLELDGNIERLRSEQKRHKEDGLRTLAREKQIEIERQHTQARVESARVARAEGLDAAQKTLAAERKTAVEDHVREILGALSKSLAQVGTVFVDPAREKLRASTEPDFTKAERVRKAAESSAPVVSRLLAERVPELAGVEELLAKIQKEFCDAAKDACRAAWG
ncbi:MAG: hypothetical protein U0271_45230 [Polyangiaceae bacterium]